LLKSFLKIPINVFKDSKGELKAIDIDPEFAGAIHRCCEYVAKGTTIPPLFASIKARSTVGSR
jgi:hypothetical protein